MVEARLELSGMQIIPQGELIEPLIPGQSVHLSWSIRSPENGTYGGMVWIHLRLIPRAGGMENRIPLTAQRITIHAGDILGLGGAEARSLSVVGLALGLVLVFGNRIGRLIRSD